MRMMVLLIQLINESEHSLSHGTQSDVASEAAHGSNSGWSSSVGGGSRDKNS